MSYTSILLKRKYSLPSAKDTLKGISKQTKPPDSSWTDRSWGSWGLIRTALKYRLRGCLTMLLLLGCPTPALAQQQHSYLGFGMSGAGRNNPVINFGDSDNLSFAFRGSLPLSKFFAFKPSVFVGQYSVQAAPTATFTFPLESQINAYIGAGYSFNMVEREGRVANNVLGNTSAPIAIGGVEFFPGERSALFIDVMFSPTGFNGEHDAASLNMGWGLRF